MIELLPFENAHRIVITGGPGAGKSTILQQIGQSGRDVQPEAARAVIAQQLGKRHPILPWVDRRRFDELVLAVMVEQFCEPKEGSVFFFDRGLPDLIGWSLFQSLDPAPYFEIIDHFRYDAPVYFARPVRRFYVQNSERPYSFAEALRIHECLLEGYAMAGYRCEQIPSPDLQAAARWIQEQIAPCLEVA